MIGTLASLKPLMRSRLQVMGSAAELVLLGGTAQQLTVAAEQLRDLERRWSRFRADSEVSRLNEAAGSRVSVSRQTRLLVELAVRGWRLTRGRYDPTLLTALRCAGYTDDFARLSARDQPRSPPPSPPAHDPGTCGRIEIDQRRGTVLLPDGASFDPGGIGKGLAADLVSADLAEAGVPGGCVNVGGDVRVWGPGPQGRCWRIAAADRTLALTDAGVATSGTRRRSWMMGGRRMHHLIDPATGQPARTGVSAATVIAPSAWQAEVCALAAVITQPAHALADLRRWGVHGLVVDDEGLVSASSSLQPAP